jgi:Protein of unknown function (DUF763)
MAAKVDSAAVQDGYQLYHHALLFFGGTALCAVQQGMSDQSRNRAPLSMAVAIGDELSSTSRTKPSVPNKPRRR